MSVFYVILMRFVCRALFQLCISYIVLGSGHGSEDADQAFTGATIARHFGYLMPKLKGPRQIFRRLLSCVVTSKILYAAPFWSEWMQVTDWKKMVAVHRRSLQLRVACCYCMVSYGAATVLSEIPPIHLLANRRTEVYNGISRDEARRALLASWQ